MQSDLEKNPSFFRNGPEEPKGPGGEHDTIIEDFNSFFEKLSSLDDLHWSSDLDPESETGESEPGGGVTATMGKAVGESVPVKKPDRQPNPSKKKENSRAIAKRAKSKFAQVNQTRKRPKVEVVTSASVSAAARSGSISTPEAGSLPVTHAAPDESFDTARAAKILKLVLVSLILFGLGLGAGWAALSLPSRFDNLKPAVKNGRHQEGMKPQAGGIESVADWGERIWGKGDSEARGIMKRFSRMLPASGKNSEKPEGLKGKEQNTRNTVTVVSGEKSLQKDRVANPSESFRNEKPIKAVKAGLAPFVAATTRESASQSSSMNHGNGNVAANDTESGGYALQVGACSSFRCVESFRSLLLGQVNSSAIKVVSQEAPEGGKVIQRIRIEPLERVEAERLKAALSAENPQFKGAYLVRAQ